MDRKRKSKEVVRGLNVVVTPRGSMKVSDSVLLQKTASGLELLPLNTTPTASPSTSSSPKAKRARRRIIHAQYEKLNLYAREVVGDVINNPLINDSGSEYESEAENEADEELMQQSTITSMRAVSREIRNYSILRGEGLHQAAKQLLKADDSSSGENFGCIGDASARAPSPAMYVDIADTAVDDDARPPTPAMYVDIADTAVDDDARPPTPAVQVHDDVADIAVDARPPTPAVQVHDDVADIAVDARSPARAIHVDVAVEQIGYEIPFDIDLERVGDAADRPPTPEIPAVRGEIEPISGDFTWTGDFSTFSGRQEAYTRTPGVHVEGRTPAALFQEVWNLDIINVIVEQTNKYASDLIDRLSEDYENFPKYLEDWYKTDASEILKLFAIFNYMTLDYRAVINEYWTTGILGMPGFREIMSRNRYIMLSKFLHFTDNDYVSATTYKKKIEKIIPILEHCNKRFSEMYTPRQAISLDESLLLWKGRLSWKQCIRTKAARFGLKSFDLCESESGYLLRTLLYAGKESSMTPATMHGFQNSTAKIVLEVMDGFLDVGHLLVMDNWYNQLLLTRYLKQHKRTDIVGTINKVRNNVPDRIKKLNPKRMEAGETLCLHCGDITCIAWKDSKLVTTISTFHGSNMVPGQRAGVSRPKPELIACYNKYMGGVDSKDQKLSMYLFERKRGVKWYIKLFKRLINTSLLNTYIIYTKLEGVPDLLHRSFRFSVSEGLLAASQVNRIRRPLPSSLLFAVTPVRLRRGENYDHFPVNYEVTPGAKKHVRRRCVNCYAKGSQKRTATSCGTCKVGLCVQCWNEYHTQAELG